MTAQIKRLTELQLQINTLRAESDRLTGGKPVNELPAKVQERVWKIEDEKQVLRKEAIRIVTFNF